MNHSAHKILKTIAAGLTLGSLTAEPQPLTGGLMHRMYRLDTSCGVYAVKLLNPAVMARPEAMDNFREAERLEALLETAGVPVLPALSYGGRKMQCTGGGQYYYVFPWYEGRAVMGRIIAREHCAAMGKALAEIHGVYRRACTVVPENRCHDWDGLIAAMAQEDPALCRMLTENRDLLYGAVEAGNRASARLPGIETICHGDIDPKNVLWRERECRDFRIIDLECLCISNPCMELYGTALSWAGCDCGAMDFDLLGAFLRSYRDAGGELPHDWETLYDACCGPLDWLAYNLRRVLGEEPENRELGRLEAEKTLNRILYCARMREKLLQYLKKI